MGSNRTPEASQRYPVASVGSSEEGSRLADPNGIIASPREEANKVGQQIFAAGGNAVDAAVAASLALGVAEPYMTGPGAIGELVYLTPEGRCHVLDCAARAPALANPSIFKVIGESTGLYSWPEVEHQANTLGPKAVTAPRLVAGLYRAHQRFGRLAWPDLVKPAVALAEEGVAIDYFTSAVLAQEMSTLKRDAIAAELYYPDGAPLPPPIGDPAILHRNIYLASALRRIEEDGPEALKSGPIADAIVRCVSKAGGIISSNDLRVADAPLIEDIEPLMKYRGWSVYGSPIPSGSITVAEILSLLQRMPDRPKSVRDPLRYERVAMAAYYSFNDRLTRLSGSDTASQAAQLLSEENVEHLAPQVRKGIAGTTNGDTGSYSRGATTHLSAVDSAGGIVSVSHTLFTLFGAHLGVPGFGFFLNNGMMWFDPRPGYPTSIGDNARALSAVSPMVIVSPGGSRRISVGGFGARHIMTAVAQIIENIVDYGQILEDAVNHPRIHEDTVQTLVDERLSTETVDRLRLRGLKPAVIRFSPTSLVLARANAVSIDLSTGDMQRGIDIRSASTWRFGAEHA